MDVGAMGQAPVLPNRLVFGAASQQRATLIGHLL
jgi:hypothetical protein